MSAEMTHRELLEMAAMAVGHEVVRVEGGAALLRGVQEPWSPLADDGDALRLAVRLSLAIDIRPHEVEVFDQDSECLASVASSGPSDDAAARRAIVLAAAQLEAERARKPMTRDDVERQYEDGIHIASGLPRATCPCGLCKKYPEPPGAPK